MKDSRRKWLEESISVKITAEPNQKTEIEITGDDLDEVAKLSKTLSSDFDYFDQEFEAPTSEIDYVADSDDSLKTDEFEVDYSEKDEEETSAPEVENEDASEDTEDSSEISEDTEDEEPSAEDAEETEDSHELDEPTHLCPECEHDPCICECNGNKVIKEELEDDEDDEEDEDGEEEFSDAHYHRQMLKDICKDLCRTGEAFLMTKYVDEAKRMFDKFVEDPAHFKVDKTKAMKLGKTSKDIEIKTDESPNYSWLRIKF